MGKVIVPAGGYKIIWASANINNGFDHTSWSLSQNGEFVSLTKPDGITIIDSLSFPVQRTDVSFGRLFSSIDSLVFFSPSSPNEQNVSLNAYLGFLPPPLFSHLGGFYTNPFSLNITTGLPGVTVVYSSDASEPNLNNLNDVVFPIKNNYPQIIGEELYPSVIRAYNSYQYLSPILIDNPINKPNDVSNISATNYRYPYIAQTNLPKARIIRAKSEKPGFLPSDVITESYFFTPSGTNSYTLPVYSLTTQESFLYDYFDGISTAGATYDYLFNEYGRIPEAGNFAFRGSAWERKANLEIYDNNFVPVNKNIDLRTHGKLSRQFNKKSFRLYFNSDIDLFNYGQQKLSSKFILRNPGTFQTHDIATSISKGLNFEYQDNKPNIMYLNGEYWGIHTTTDFIDEDYLAKKFNLNSSNIDIIKDDILDAESDIEYNDLLSFLETSDLSNVQNYDPLSKLIDIDNFNDYIITEIFLNNTDWPNNNTLVWRNKNLTTQTTPLSPTDGRWRWLLLDLDGTLVGKNDTTINAAIGGQHTSFVFGKLLSNDTYKNKFLNRYADLAGSHFNPTRTIPVAQSAINKYAPEMGLESARWDNTNVEGWNLEMAGISNYLNERNLALYGQFLNRFNIESTFDLTVSTNDISRGYIRVNTIDILPSTPGLPQNTTQWSGKYFKGIPLKITAKPKKYNKFLYWIHNGITIYDSVLVINTLQNESYQAVFEEFILSTNPIP